jgi:ABC-type branched-subunit amino acid transport system substrate-binding protein
VGVQALADRADLDRAWCLDHLQKNGKGKSVATIGISTSYGEGFLKAFEAIAAQRGFKVVATEKYNQTDPSVTAQVLKIVAANPDAVYIFAAGTPGALPQIELAPARLQGPGLPDAGRRQQRLPARRRQSRSRAAT